MPLGRTLCVGLTGLAGHLVDVEADLGQGLPALSVSGLPDAACAQSPDRVRSAAANVGFPLPARRIVVNLSPASLAKHGTVFDLAIAVSVLAAARELPAEAVTGVVHLGELGLDGSVRPVHGVLPAVLAGVRAGMREFVVPAANAAEARLVPDITVHAVDDLGAVIRGYRSGSATPVPAAEPACGPDPDGEPTAREPDLADIVGQTEARAAVEAAAAGGHHLLLIGPPGAGKTMLAERLPGLLPRLGPEAALEVAAIESLTGAVRTTGLREVPPFVAPHHTASTAALLGGGSARPRPGAVSRAHQGVLFLDEAPEFRRDALESLRQPLESGEVCVARADGQVVFPARFQLVLAANPCPCGGGADRRGRDCTCTSVRRRTYLAKLSGPLLDRVDLQVRVAPVRAQALSGARGEGSAPVAERVALARARQEARWARHGWGLNAHAPGHVLRGAPYRLPAQLTRPLDRALDSGALTLRAYDRVLRVAWTLADLGGAESPGVDELGRALALRVQAGAA